MSVDLEDSRLDLPHVLRPPIPSGLQPRLLRFFSMASGPRLAIGSFVILGLIMVGSWSGGNALRSHGGPKLGLMIMLVGVLAGLLALLMAFLGVLSVKSSLKDFRSGPMVPGVVVSVKPNIVVAMVDMGQCYPGVAYGLSQMTVRTLGIDRPEPGARIACYTRPVNEMEADSIHQIEFNLVSWGTSDPSDLTRCFELLGEEPYRRLEACIRRGPLPSADTENILLDPAMEFFGKNGRGGEESGEPSRS